MVEVARLRPLDEAGAPGALRPRMATRMFLLILRNPLGLAGLVLILTLVVVGSLAPFIAPHGENQMTFIPFQNPSWAHPFGTDQYGRDILSRVIFGARISLAVGFLSVIAGTAAGTTIGMVSGLLGGWVDNLIQRAGDTVMAFPALILLLIIIRVLGPSIENVVIVIGVGIVPGVQRVIRGAALAEKQNQYIEAAQAIGASSPRILFRHLAPNVMPLAIVIATTLLGGAILAEAALSFLGLGVPPPNPSWGADVSLARNTFPIHSWWAFFPGLAIALTVLGFNFLGDALRDILDPRLRGATK
jgi:peptide/nickel transport system permease protein